MTDIVAFLNARLDEDEAAATPGEDWSFGFGASSHNIFNEEGDYVAVCIAQAIGNDPVRNAEHIARHNPARVLREVKAKRRTMARHYADDDGSCVGCHFANDETRWAETIEECPELRDMASVYADHPDYGPAWTIAT